MWSGRGGGWGCVWGWLEAARFSAEIAFYLAIFMMPLVFTRMYYISFSCLFFFHVYTCVCLSERMNLSRFTMCDLVLLSPDKLILQNEEQTACTHTKGAQKINSY